MATVADARTIRIDSEAAWKLLGEAKGITTAKGEKVQTWNPRRDDQAAILQQVMGPSGNLRAPTLRVKDEFLVGFNAELYESWLGSR